MCASLLEDEDFFLQIDCHTRFIENWDTRLLDNWAEANDEKAIITCFPLTMEKMEKHAEEPLNRSTGDFKFYRKTIFGSDQSILAVARLQRLFT